MNNVGVGEGNLKPPYKQFPQEKVTKDVSAETTYITYFNEINSSECTHDEFISLKYVI